MIETEVSQIPDAFGFGSCALKVSRQFNVYFVDVGKSKGFCWNLRVVLRSKELFTMLVLASGSSGLPSVEAESLVSC